MIWLFVLGAALAGAPFVAELARQPVQAVRKGADLAKLSRGQTRYLWFGPKDGPVIVLVHGLTTPSPVFAAVAAGLARQGARVLTYDLYGRGRSDRPGGAQTRDVFVRQLRELLVDQRVAEPITLVGYSMGGVIATAYSAKYLDQVERLVLLASAGLCHKFDRFTAFCVKAPWIGDWLMVLFGPRGLRRVAEEVRHLDSQVPDIAEVIEAETRMRGYMPAVLSSLRNCLVGDQRRTHGALANTCPFWPFGETRILSSHQRPRTSWPRPIRRRVKCG